MKMEPKFSFSISSAFSLSIFLLLISAATTTAKTSSATTTYKKFIKTSCNSATYPKLCYNSLSIYYSAIKTDSEKLCDAALSVTHQAAKNCSSLISSLSKLKELTPSDSAVVRDCGENIKDSVDEFKDSLKAMRKAGGEDREFQMANVRTWVSAAMTDEYTCLDEMEEKAVSKSVEKKISKCVKSLCQHTSNLLALMKSLN